jgi:hypothetical protein
VIWRVEFLRAPHDAPPDQLLMLTGYFDESGQESDQRVVLAGFLGNNDEWTALKGPWRIALGKRKALHMTELRWHGKRASRTKALLERLGPIPRECGLLPVWASVRVSDYLDLVDDTILTRTLSKGYIVAIQPLLAGILTYASLLDERVALVFEQQDQFSGIATAIGTLFAAFDFFKTADGLPRLCGIQFIPKGSSPLTEPSDYLAFQRLHNFRDPLSEKSVWYSSILRENDQSISIPLSRSQVRALFSSPSQNDLRKIGRELEPGLREIRRKRGWVEHGDKS